MMVCTCNVYHEIIRKGCLQKYVSDTGECLKREVKIKKLETKSALQYDLVTVTIGRRRKQLEANDKK